MGKLEEQKIKQQTEEIISKLKTMSCEELNQLYSQYKELSQSIEAETTKVKQGIASATEEMKDRPQMSDDLFYKIVFGSCFVSMIGGATLGGIFGEGARDFFSGAFLGTAYGSIFVSLITAYIYHTKPVAKVVQAIKKYALERKVGELEKQQEQVDNIKSAIEGLALDKA